MEPMEATRTTRGFGPANPETFFAAQKRNRRATWRMSALCTFAAILMGIPLTLVITPLLYAVGMIGLEILNHFSPQPELLQSAGNLAHLGGRVADYVVNQRGTLQPGELVLGLSLILLPGMLVTFGLWAGMLALFRHGGVGGTLASINAREPNQADLKELQLADAAQEMAIAAGLPAPKLMLVDSIGANAAAIGSSPADAHIVVSRRLLDDLDRDQLQAILAHLIGSIGNGDLGVAFMVTSVFETSGLLQNLITIPFDAKARARVWRVVRYMLTGGTPEQKAVEAAAIAESLATSLDSDSGDPDKYFHQGNPGLFKKIYRLLMYPLIFTNMTINLTLWMFLNVVLGPSMAMLWRTRRYLADATSVELTRNPDALARALQCLSEDQTMLEGGDWATHLFIVNPKGDSGLRGLQPSEAKKNELISAWASTAHLAAAPGNPVPASAADWAGVRQEILATVKAARSGDVHAMERLQEMSRMAGRDPALQVLTAINPADAIAAMRGDPAALQRIEQMKEFHEAGQPKRREHKQILSFASFHPPLAKRAKRLQKMGSHLIAPVRSGGVVLTVFMTLLYAIIVPLLTVAAGLMLIVIAMMIGMNLMLLTMWLMVIHWIFVWLNSR
jgi:Zn-dependent protease with chaperone function